MEKKNVPAMMRLALDIGNDNNSKYQREFLISEYQRE